MVNSITPIIMHTAINGEMYVFNMVIRSDNTVKSANPNGVTRLESTIPFMTPNIIQKELIRIRTNALLLNKYTKVKEANTINEL